MTRRNKKRGRKPFGHYADEREVLRMLRLSARTLKGGRTRSLAEIAGRMNLNGLKTMTGRCWTKQNVRYYLNRMEQKASKKPRPKQVRKVQLSHRDFLSKAQLRKLREAQPDDLRELLDVMVGTGLRASELIALQVRDVDVSRQMLEVRRGKGARQRTVVISQAAAQVFERWIRATDGRKKSVILRNRDGRPMTYSNLYDRVVKMGKMAGMDHLHPHVFRHTFATILYENQKDIKAVKEQLGHGSIATTDIYAKSSTTAKIEQIKVFDQILPAGSWLLKNTREY